ncbi:CRISPR-associated helicase Cas3' [Leptolyngbya sp. ST-U4]|uniref:CRISPR-associated helicase Cas3' n=1 Tax=Leptolyngbya sp. ST-U4 TaxID=2933912 RepID=UPI0032983114
MFKTLLAKSLSADEAKNDRARGAAKFTGHISFVLQAADVLVETLGETILKQLGLEPTVSLTYFGNTVRLGAYWHDPGKANDHFQTMVYLKTIDPNTGDPKLIDYRKKLISFSKKHSDRQMLRHEVLSGILGLYIPSFRQWLEQCPDSNFMIAMWAAIGHHLKIGIGENRKPSGEVGFIPDGTGDELNIYTHHPDFRAFLEMGSKSLGLPTQLPELPQEVWSKKELNIALTLMRQEFLDFEAGLDWEQQKFVAAVKATVIAADLAGSALPLANEDFKTWMRDVLALTLTQDDFQELVNQRLQGKPLHEFQKQIAQSIHRTTLVAAGCGGGKTIGAYKWGQKHAEGRKLFFCYPTTGTASQGFVDYAEGTDIEAALMHSRADLDRELLFSGDSEDRDELDSRLVAFQAWRKKLIICTVDTVLGLIQNNRRPLYAWAAIANAAFVFDEVHAYDKRLFGALLKFIKTFRGAPILLMSASFTPEQLQKIQEVVTELGEECDKPIQGSKELEQLKRYQVQWLPEVDEPAQAEELWHLAIEALCRGEKILWVTNSVQTCIDLYREAQSKLAAQLPALKPLIYHSRYRYKDRLKKHEAVVNAFKENQPVLAITTQVCEMSLDLSADLLISALASPAALIQRLGRLNRRMTRADEGTRLALIYNWSASQPYTSEELETGKQLVKQVAQQTAVSQEDLAKIAVQLNSRTEEEIHSRWLQDNWCTYPDMLRDGGGTVTVLLQDDLSKIRDAADLKKAQGKEWTFMREAQGWSVPIRIPSNLSKWKRCRFYPIAPSSEICYCEETGAEPCKS